MTPKAFISYSWSSPSHEEWVIRLATDLMESGVDVTLDKWALKEGDDAHAFMEQMVTNPDITKVVMVCDRIYAEKANGRSGGVGTETQIITPEIYGKQSQNKFVAVISERDDTGKEYVPAFYKSRVYIDMSDPAVYAEGFEKLLRWTFEKPLHVKPPLGKVPAFLEANDDRPQILTTVRFRRAQEMLRNGQAHAGAAVSEYFDAVAEGLELFRLKGADFAEESYDDAVVKSLSDFLPYRDECITLFQLLSSYAREEDAYEAIHRFLENVLVYTDRPPEVTQWQEWDFDNYRFIAHELHLYAIAALLKANKFHAAALMLNAQYYIPSRADRGKGALADCSIFLKELRSLEQRKRRLKLNRYSLHADFLQERATLTSITFHDVVQADFIIFLHARLDNRFWYPITNVFESFLREPLEIFARARSKAYFERLRPLVGNRTAAALKADIAKLEADPNRLPRWSFHMVVPSRCVGVEELATLP